MTDKEKQIEEMARTIHYDYWGACDADSCSDCCHSDLNICNDKIIAEKLYDKLLPKGSVVLNKEEYRNEFKSRFNKGYKQARKETAREILKELYEQIDEKTPKWVETQIKMKAKQYGVEVEE